MEIKRSRIARLSGAGGRRCQRGWDAAGAGEGAALASLPGKSVCGSVARCPAAGPVGRYSGPRWPQPMRAAALAARTSVLT